MICSRMMRPTPATSIMVQRFINLIHCSIYTDCIIPPLDFYLGNSELYSLGTFKYTSLAEFRGYINNKTEDLRAFAPRISSNSLMSSAGLASNQRHEFTAILQPNTLLGFVYFSAFAPQTLIPEIFK